MPMRYDLAICGLADIAGTAKTVGATHMISLLEPGPAIKRPRGIHRENHLHLSMTDTKSEASLHAPTLESVRAALEFGRDLHDGSSLLVHCLAGVSRSGAIGFALIAQEWGPDHIDDAVDFLREIRPEAAPNPFILRIADEILGFDGLLASKADFLEQQANAYRVAQLLNRDFTF